MHHDPLATLNRATLARLGREYMLAAQCNSRVGYAALAMNHGPEAYKGVAIDNWMAASPVYTRRMQRAMQLRGDSDVETILKGLQLDCGFSHQYFDTRFRMVAEEEGEFWLPRCGALLEAEPRGEEAVRTMCHDIEDPTFDATAVATNPRAQVRPIHRPPRAAADQAPHCHWRVTINHDAEPVVERAITGCMGQRLLSNLAIERGVSIETGGWDYYDGPLIEQLHLEAFSQSALVVICKELAIQFHLLLASLGLALEQRYGADAVQPVAEFQMTGSAWATSERLVRCLGLQDGGLDAIAQVLEVHPALQPREYVSVALARCGDTLRIALNDCPAAQEAQSLGWFPLLQHGGAAPALQALVQGVDARARLEPAGGEAAAWDIRLAKAAAEEPLAVQIARGTVLYGTRLEDQVQLLEVV